MKQQRGTVQLRCTRDVADRLRSVAKDLGLAPSTLLDVALSKLDVAELKRALCIRVAATVQTDTPVNAVATQVVQKEASVLPPAVVPAPVDDFESDFMSGE